MPEVPTSFTGDLFKRSGLADNLINGLHGLTLSQVITIDAPWGDGKTFFATNLHKKLEENNAYSVYIDAFEHDYYDDPLALLTSAIYLRFQNGPINSSTVAELKKKAAVVASKLLPSLAKLAVSIVTAGVLNSRVQEDTATAIADAIGDATSGIIEEQIENFATAQEGIDRFKESLATIAQECVEKSKQNESYPNGLPLIIIIDELDRCRPTFALTLLERIKHFFNIDNVVFILMANKNQLNAYIKGMYGSFVDAGLYLEKFIDLSINLPSLPLGQTMSNSYEYAKSCPPAPPSPNNGSRRSRLNNSFCEFIKEYCRYNYVPLRCINKYYNYTSLIDENAELRFTEYIGILIIIKLLQPSLYNSFLNRDKQAADEVLEFMTGKIKDRSKAIRFQTLIEAMIKCHSEQNADPSPYCSAYPVAVDTINRMSNGQPQDAFFRAAQYIDFLD